MRKTSMLCVASLVLGASLVMTAPARAAAEDCTIEPPPDSSTVYLEDGQIRVNPGGPSADVAAVRAWATYHVNCLRNAPLLDPVGCIAGLGVGGPYVYQDPNGEYVVDYQALIDHAGAVAACLQ